MGVIFRLTLARTVKLNSPENSLNLFLRITPGVQMNDGVENTQQQQMIDLFKDLWKSENLPCPSALGWK